MQEGLIGPERTYAFDTPAVRGGTVRGVESIERRACDKALRGSVRMAPGSYWRSDRSPRSTRFRCCSG